MKKFLSVILVLAISLCGVFALVGCSKNENKNFDMVFITDGGTISDGAYNQSAWDGVKEFAEEKNMSYRYYQPSVDENGDVNVDTIGIAKLAEKYQAPVFTHASETKSEVEDCIKRNGMSPTKYLNELGIFNYGGGAYHSVWIDDEDIEIYKGKGIWAVINACSNAKLASGIAPVSKLLKSGVKVAVGTDGASSNNALDMFREMYTICATQKLNDKDAASTDANDILKASTIGSAKCMGLTDCDVIDVDKKADLIVIDMHRPSMQPINNITKNLVYSGGKDVVKMTMINGKILYDNGEFKNIDIEKIYANAQAVIDRIR